MNNIAHVGEQQPSIKVKSVRPLEGHQLWVRFTTNEEKIFDFSPLLDFPCYQPLKEKSVFNSVYVDLGVAVWNNGAINIAPERLYTQGLPFKLTAE